MKLYNLLCFGLFNASNSPRYKLYNIVMYRKYLLTETNVCIARSMMLKKY